MKKFISLALLCLLSTYNFGQITIPVASPTSIVNQKIGLGEVELSYSRPSSNGREIFGNEALVRYEEFWRTGANAVTTLTVSKDFIIQGQALPKGKYIILTKPNKTNWKLLMYTYKKQNWNKFTTETPIATIETSIKKRNDFRESFLFYFDDLKLDQATLIIEWANTAIELSFQIPAHHEVMTRINQVMKGPSSFDYFNAASYLSQSNMDLPLALTYIQKATSNDNPRFFFYRIEATILAKMKRYKEAIEAAKKSIILAKKSGNVDAVLLNKRSIHDWYKIMVRNDK